MRNDYVSSFVEAAKLVMDSFGLQITEGEVVEKCSPFQADAIIIVVGLTGDLHGQAIINMEKSTACDIASAMMGGIPAELNEVTKSAIAELANMIIGNAVTLLSQINVMLDITPPSVLTGENMHISTTSRSISLPFYMENEKMMEFSLSAKELLH